MQNDNFLCYRPTLSLVYRRLFIGRFSITIMILSRNRELFVIDLTLILWKPMFYYILNIEMTSESLSSFCIELRAAGEWLCEVWWWLWGHFYVYNLIEHRFSWTKCFIIYRTNTAQHDATCRNSSQVFKLKIRLLQHLFVFSHDIA